MTEFMDNRYKRKFGNYIYYFSKINSIMLQRMGKTEILAYYILCQLNTFDYFFL